MHDKDLVEICMPIDVNYLMINNCPFYLWVLVDDVELPSLQVDFVESVSVLNFRHVWVEGCGSFAKSYLVIQFLHQHTVLIMSFDVFWN